MQNTNSIAGAAPTAPVILPLYSSIAGLTPLALSMRGGISARVQAQAARGYMDSPALSRPDWLAGAAALLLAVLVLLIAIFRKIRHKGRRLENLARKRTNEMQKQQQLLHIVNDAAALLLESDATKYSVALVRGMEQIGRCLDAGRVCLWQNGRGDGDDRPLYYRQVFNWESEPRYSGKLEFTYRDSLPDWEKRLSRGACVNGPLENLPEEERERLKAYDIRSILAVPIFLKGEFWGFISLDDLKSSRRFPEGEIDILRSWGLLAVSAIQRGEIALNMKHTLTKLEAVINHYKGIIWSVDNHGVITTFNGKYLESLDMEPDFLVGKSLEEDWPKTYVSVAEMVDKTFSEGPQDWIEELGGSVFHSSSSPMADADGNVLGVVGSTDDVTENDKLQKDLRTAVEAAQAASRAKSAFLANMSHEIRTPMNAIIGMTNIGLSSPELERKNYSFTKISDASNHLLGVINDILDMSKIEANKFELSPAPFHFEKTLRRAADVINFRVDEKRQRLSVDIDGHIPAALVGDDQRLAQVVANLLSNAVKFTPEEGAISLSALLLGEEDGVCTVRVSVTDTGIGITPEQQEKLFQSFQQAENTTARKFGGTGLGLAISESIVKMMGGRIWVESEPGKGSAFTFTIKAPIGEDTTGAAPLVEEPAGAALTFEGKRILLAEDVDINREIVLALLEPTLLRIDCAENGAEALRMFREAPRRYDMIFMDVQMPEMDGYEATRQIRALENEGTGKIPIIAMTANVFREDVEKCLEAGMTGHIGKPLDFAQVLKELREYLKN